MGLARAPFHHYGNNNGPCEKTVGSDMQVHICLGFKYAIFIENSDDVIKTEDLRIDPQHGEFHRHRDLCAYMLII